MAGKWRKKIDPVTGKSVFTNEPEPDEAAKKQETPINHASGAREANALYCQDCQKKIEGRIITVVDSKETYHADCFSCVKCNRQFEMNNLKYTMFEGKPWCFRCMAARDEAEGHAPERLYYDAISANDPLDVRIRLGDRPEFGNSSNDPVALAAFMKKEGHREVGQHDQPCKGCGNSIAGTAAIGTSHGPFHEECFVCGLCKQRILDDGHGFRDDVPYHSGCLKKEAAPPCMICNKPASGKVYSVKEARVHPECYVCSICRKSLADGHLVHHNKLYCSSACKAKDGGAPAAAQPAAAKPAPAINHGPFADVKICDQCGHDMPKHAKFCGGCGKRFD